MPIEAIIFVPAHCSDAARWLDHCFAYCVIRGYRPAHVVREFRDVITLLAAGMRAKVVYGPAEHLPGFESVTDPPGAASTEDRARPRWASRQ